MATIRKNIEAVIGNRDYLLIGNKRLIVISQLRCDRSRAKRGK
jgi:hypothetical protein